MMIDLHVLPDAIDRFVCRLHGKTIVNTTTDQKMFTGFYSDNLSRIQFNQR